MNVKMVNVLWEFSKFYHKKFLADHPASEMSLYQIALPATHLRRYSGLVTAIQVFDLIHVYDAIIPAKHRVI